jgi:catechol 2,3-dioxygenase-like lactoylglutathione lyase family enzyme
MFYGLSHVDVPVRDLERSLALYVGVLDFKVKKRAGGWADIDTGTVTLRFVESDRVERSVSLRVAVSDVPAAYDTLLQKGATPVYQAMHTPELEHVAALRDPDGHTLIVWRELSEDEYGFDPALPTEMRWNEEADALLKSLLRAVPSLFRGLARRKVTKNAEYLARDTNVVTKEHVVRAYILSSAKITRYRTRQPLIDHGYDPERYREDFEA